MSPPAFTCPCVRTHPQLRTDAVGRCVRDDFAPSNDFGPPDSVCVAISDGVTSIAKTACAMCRGTGTAAPVDTLESFAARVAPETHNGRAQLAAVLSDWIRGGCFMADNVSIESVSSYLFSWRFASAASRDAAFALVERERSARAAREVRTTEHRHINGVDTHLARHIEDIEKLRRTHMPPPVIHPDTVTLRRIREALGITDTADIVAEIERPRYPADADFDHLVACIVGSARRHDGAIDKVHHARGLIAELRETLDAIDLAVRESNKRRNQPPPSGIAHLRTDHAALACDSAEADGL